MTARGVGGGGCMNEWKYKRMVYITMQTYILVQTHTDRHRYIYRETDRQIYRHTYRHIDR